MSGVDPCFVRGKGDNNELYYETMLGHARYTQPFGNEAFITLYRRNEVVKYKKELDSGGGGIYKSEELHHDINQFFTIFIFIKYWRLFSRNVRLVGDR